MRRRDSVCPLRGRNGGLLFHDGERTIIGLNSLDTKVRQRFAVAHELGHLALHGDKEIYVDRTFSSVRWKGSAIESDAVESAANEFAAALLVPPSMITPELKGKKIDYSNSEMISGFAERYNVGTEVMIYRLMKLGARHWVLRGYGLWAVEERFSGNFLGRIGCLNPEGFPAFEIAYTLGRWAWGKGYAREGAAAALRYARETLGRTEITSIIRPANTASIRVATSLGAVAGESVEFFGAPSVIYRYPRQ